MQRARSSGGRRAPGMCEQRPEGAGALPVHASDAELWYVRTWMSRLMFRAMKKADDHMPLLGRTARTLGVRVSAAGAVPEDPPEFDVYPDAAGYVTPGRGLSVAMDDPGGLPRHRKPRSLGGEGRDPVFSLRVSAVGKVLNVNVDRPPHALIEPAARCSLAEYEAALAVTRTSWKVYDV